MIPMHSPLVSNVNNDDLINVNITHKIGQCAIKNFKSNRFIFWGLYVKVCELFNIFTYL